MTEIEKAHRLISDMTAAQHKLEREKLEMEVALRSVGYFDEDGDYWFIPHLKAGIERRNQAIDSLTSWLLHRFGLDSPEGREAMTARTALSGPHP